MTDKRVVTGSNWLHGFTLKKRVKKLKPKNPLMRMSVAVSTIALSGSAAYAQGYGGATLSTVANATSTNVYSMTTLITTASYVSGAFLAGSGIMSLKKTSDSGASQEPIHKGLGRLLTGGALCAIPSVMNIAINSMGVDPNQGVGVVNASGPRLGG